ncbi:uncharacterized protein CCR75_005997 [Bremia lactucae]|uniref:Dynein light chain n=1 Tax=Bremia lactucae TaxID=4779 RepID=A0A976FQE5_BRELC|nr:hypothetical protein CCR75_005997 [Bremia lactucae]
MISYSADFKVSKVPTAPVALQVASKKAVNDASKKVSGTREFATEIRTRLEPLMGYGWHIIVGKDFAVDLRYRKGACVLLYSKASKIKVMLYRTTSAVTSPPNKEHEALIKRSDQVCVKKEKSVVYESSMTDEMRDIVVDKTNRLYSHYESFKDKDAKIASALKHSLTFAYGPTWQVIVSPSREIACLPIADTNMHADFMVKKLRVMVYRHGGVHLDRHLDLLQLGKRLAFVLASICLLLYSFMAFYPSKSCDDSANVAGQHLSIDGGNLPGNCTAEELDRANSLTWWKTTSVVGVSGFTILASLIRMYSNSVASKLKRL